MGFNWRVTWACDNRFDDWNVRGFETLQDARKFARALVSENEGNHRFNFFVEAMCLMNSNDVLDETLVAYDIRLA